MQSTLGKPIRLRDFVRVGDYYFSVVGYKNKPLVKCMLRYIPDEKGNRMKNGKKFRKISQDEVGKFFKDYFRDGLFYLPYDLIDDVYKPEERLKFAMKYREVKSIVEFFEGIPKTEMGVTGSRLIDLASDESDVDFIVYGKFWFYAREKLRRGIEIGKLSEPDFNTWDFIYKKRKISLPFDVFLAHERRKYHRAFLGSTYFDLLYVRDYDEINRSIPEEKGKKLGKIEIEAEVLDDNFIFDYPAYYPIKHREIKAVLCFTHTYVGQAFRGERIVARGDLEIIDNQKYLIVGTKREVEDEYIVSLNLLNKLGLLDEFMKWKT